MIFLRRLAFLFTAVALAVPLASAATRAKPTRPSEVDNSSAYKGAIVVDAMTGKVLVEDRADYSGTPASMTKLMTFAVLQDKLNAGSFTLSTPVRIMNEDNIGGTQVFLDPRETFPVEELMYAMMIQSANDAARALARFSAGSVESFVALMNAKARELGMTHTTFKSPHGLPPTGRRLADYDMTTPRDYAVLCRHLLLNTTILKYSSVQKRDFGPERVKGPMKMDNHNKLLGKVDGVDGLKTGFTDAAGYCTSITALRNGRRVIVIVMGSLGPGGQHDFGRLRDVKAIELLGKGFAALPAGSPAFVSNVPAEIPVIQASKPEAAKPADDNTTIKVSIPGAKKK
jgi:D-alanyl-D-alanine carboxypeptidase